MHGICIEKAFIGHLMCLNIKLNAFKTQIEYSSLYVELKKRIPRTDRR